jgi:hypothetical protein
VFENDLRKTGKRILPAKRDIGTFVVGLKDPLYPKRNHPQQLVLKKFLKQLGIRFS